MLCPSRLTVHYSQWGVVPMPKAVLPRGDSSHLSDRPPRPFQTLVDFNYADGAIGCVHATTPARTLTETLYGPVKDISQHRNNTFYVLF